MRQVPSLAVLTGARMRTVWSLHVEAALAADVLGTAPRGDSLEFSRMCANG